MPEIFRGDVSPKWDHLSPKRKMLPRSNYYCGEVILPICCCFPPFPICLLLLIYIFYLTCCFLLPCLLSPEWDHLCPNRKILHRSNYYCAWRGYFANLLFSPVFSFVCLCLYIFLFDFVLFCLLLGFHPSGTICSQDI